MTNLCLRVSGNSPNITFAMGASREVPPHPRPLSREALVSTHRFIRVEGEEFGGELFKFVKRIMFQQRHRRQQHPQPGQQGWCGVWPTAFRQATAEADQHILEFDCFRRLIGLQLPDDHTSHRRDEQTAGNGPSGLLQPLLKLQTVAFKQLEKTFNSPSPVVAASQKLSAAQLDRQVGQQQPLGQNHLSLFIAKLHGDEPQAEGPSRGLVLLSLDVFLGRSVQHDLSLGHPQLSRLPVVSCVSRLAEQAVVPQLRADLAQKPGFSLPFDPPIIAPHEEVVAGLVPAPVMIHRIGLTIDDVQQRLRHAPRSAGIHRGQDLFQVTHAARSRRPGAEIRFPRFQVHFHRGQRAAIVGTDQQCRRQFVAHIRFVSELRQVPFAGRMAVTQFAPVEHQHGEGRARSVGPRPPFLAQGFDQIGQLHPVVVQKSPRRLCAGPARTDTRQTRDPCRQLGRVTHVRVNQNQIPPLKPPIHRRCRNPLHPTVLTRDLRCVRPMPARGEGSRTGRQICPRGLARPPQLILPSPGRGAGGEGAECKRPATRDPRSPPADIPGHPQRLLGYERMLVRLPV